eukprot:CAMPEP_0114574420 /NCGR_PEP_ID=MMETSP0114-20121206/19391_1 /TAXON_ID=31324 /ORGANISM="Goniomonas sp, Strain m" /LENGTH=145 /DNA_ID=CAMNT_0001761847 /DNA_START=54 /DNA_END=491 /DNA_ORIENTATION=+
MVLHVGRVHHGPAIAIKPHVPKVDARSEAILGEVVDPNAFCVHVPGQMRVEKKRADFARKTVRRTIEEQKPLLELCPFPRADRGDSSRGVLGTKLLLFREDILVAGASRTHENSEHPFPKHRVGGEREGPIIVARFNDNRSPLAK